MGPGAASTGGGQAVALGFAVAAALGFAVAATLQQRVASQLRTGGKVDPAVLLRLARRPLWLAAFGIVLVHFSFQATALAKGRLLLVEPVLASGLLFALPLSARLSGRRMSRADWAGALATAAGLTSFLLLAAPTGGRTTVAAPRLGWMAALLVVAFAAAIAAALRLPPRGRAVVLGAAAGLGAAGTDACTKTVAAMAGSHGVAVLVDPRLAFLAVIGLMTFTLQQNAYRTAGLAACLPVIAVLQPVTGCVLGALVYGERLSGGPAHLAGDLLAAVVAAWGIARLARSPLVEQVYPAEPAVALEPLPSQTAQ